MSHRVYARLAKVFKTLFNSNGMNNTNEIAWYSREVDAIIVALKSNLTKGLDSTVASHKLTKDGYNKLPDEVTFSTLRAVYKQLINPLALILIFAAIATIFLHEYLDAFVIIVALFINITLGVVQEGKAARIFKSLDKAQETKAVVIRDGRKKTILASELVVGDIVLIESGFSVPADMRIAESKGIVVDESSLTGEWIGVEKTKNTIKTEDLPISEQTNMIWMSTIVVAGSGVGIVTAVGENAKIGKIAQSTTLSLEHLTPLQKNIRHLARILMFFIALTILTLILLGISNGEVLADMILIALAIAVAAMPEGLPAAVTVALALSMENILKKGGLVKNLVAAETLGSATIILTDKTGTLTEGVMILSGIYSAEGIEQDVIMAKDDNREVLRMAVLASDAFIEEDASGNKAVHGRPIEVAIIKGGQNSDILQDELFKSGNSRLDFARFDPERRYAVSLNGSHKGSNQAYITGSPEHILARSGYYLKNGEIHELTQEVIELFKQTQDKLSAQGKRFTAIAFVRVNENTIPSSVLDSKTGKDFVFVGLLGFEDMIRHDVPTAIAKTKQAGVRIIMLTGDHAETARAVALRTGIIDENNDTVYTGKQTSKMTDSELVLALTNTSVFARVLPEQKLRIARLLRAQGEIVAMTGDGINDAPALAAADIGIAVGSGTDVAKSAADMILLKDSFSIITSAINEGRRVIDNIKKIVAYLLSTSFGEIILIGGSLAISAPLPILPTQILWANIVEEGLMSFPFAFEPKEPGTEKRTPASARYHNILSYDMKKFLFAVALTTGLLLLCLYMYLLNKGLPIENIRTIMFLAVSIDSVFAGIAFKNLSMPVWKMRILSNKYLLAGIAGSTAVLVAAFIVPPLSTILSLEAIALADVMLVVAIGFINLLIIEVAKKFTFSKRLAQKIAPQKYPLP